MTLPEEDATCREGTTGSRKEAGELGGQLESAEFDALVRIDGGIEILLQNRKIIEAVMRKKIVKPPCENLLGEELRAIVWLICEEGRQDVVDGVTNEREFDVGGDATMADEILFEPDSHAACGDSDAFRYEDVIQNTELSRLVLPSVTISLGKAFKAVMGVKIETRHG